MLTSPTGSCPAARGRRDRLPGGVLPILLAGGRGSRLHELTDRLCKPAVPFIGRTRIVDFTVSNLHASGFGEVLVAMNVIDQRTLDLVLEEQRKETRLEESRRSPARVEAPAPQRKIDFFDKTAGDTVIPPLPANEEFKPAAPVEEPTDHDRDFWDRKPVDRREQRGRRSS